MELLEITTGAVVVDSDGERLGSVIAATAEYIVAEQGFFFPTDFYIPRSVIDQIEDAIIKLTISKADVLEHGWSVQPKQHPASTDESETPDDPE